MLKYTNLFNKAKKLYKEDEESTMAYFSKKDRDASYYMTMLKKGTLADKINSLSLLIQKNPARSLTYLGQLMALAKKKNRK